MSQLVDEDYSKRPWMETVTGRKFWPATPRLEDYTIFDIAHALSLKCRYNGHCKHFYSVGEHSWLIAVHLRQIGMPTNVQLDALLHDSGEAYLPDIPRPIKHFFPEHKRFEAEILRQVRQFTGLDKFGDPHPLIKQLDGRMITNERAVVMHPSKNEWVMADAIPGVYPVGVAPDSVMYNFLDLYRELMFELHGEPKFLWFGPGVFNGGKRRELGYPVYDETKGVVPDVRAIDVIGGCAWVNVATPDNPVSDMRYVNGDYASYIAPQFRCEPSALASPAA